MRLTTVLILAGLVACTGDTDTDTKDTTTTTDTGTETDTDTTPTGDTAPEITLTGSYTGNCLPDVPKKYQGKGLKKDFDMVLDMDLTETDGTVTGTGGVRISNTFEDKNKKPVKKVQEFDLAFAGTFDGASAATLFGDVTAVGGKVKDATLRYDGELLGDDFDGTLFVLKPVSKGTPKELKKTTFFTCELSR
ncbi:MAG: hypothetical protein KTR31_10845 [Myxococcales bacterium]|nr:hypothetical protein [Myxococcales bacterium]